MGLSVEVGGGLVAGGDSGIKEAAVWDVGSAAGCGGGSAWSPIGSQRLVFRYEASGLKRTVLRPIFGFCDTSLACSWSFYKWGGGRCHGPRWRGIGARRGLRLRWLLLLAAAEKAAKNFLDLG